MRICCNFCEKVRKPNAFNDLEVQNGRTEGCFRFRVNSKQSNFGSQLLESVPAMAYDCEVDQEKMLQYIHFNRHSNTLLIEHNRKLTRELEARVETLEANSHSSSGCLIQKRHLIQFFPTFPISQTRI